MISLLGSTKHLGICRRLGQKTCQRSTFAHESLVSAYTDESIQNIKKKIDCEEAAEIYIEQEDLHNEIRFDIISIVKNNFEEICEIPKTTLRMLFKNENHHQNYYL